MKQICGARGAFRSDISFSTVPSATTITYEGILNANYFKLDSKVEKKQ